MTRPFLALRWTTVLLAALATLAVAQTAGCGPAAPTAVVDVQRGELKPGQTVWAFRLQSRWAWYSRSPDGWYRLLLNLPLPGARGGSPKYVLFARFRPADGVHQFLPGQSEQALFGGLSRTKGEFNELWMVSQGQMRTKWTDHGTRLDGTFDLTASDGLTLTGRFSASANEPALVQFEQVQLRSLQQRGAGATTQPASQPATGAKSKGRKGSAGSQPNAG
jgi:hypothetical protein